MVRIICYVLASWFLISSCGSWRDLPASVSEYFTPESIFSDHFTGFALYDPLQQKTIYNYQADHSFTPASNTKIITLFSALKTLSDSVTAIQYHIENDTVFIWGMGDPSTLNPEFNNQDRALNFISHLNLPVIFCADNFMSERFGSGWAWDDYLYYYQAEKSSLPLFGNLLHVDHDQARNELVLYPNLVQVNTHLDNEFYLWRSPEANQYQINWTARNAEIHIASPLHINDSLIAGVFSQYAPKGFKIAKICRQYDSKKQFNSISIDTVYTEMMQHSDNFIAEQLLLSVAGKLSDTLATHIAIEKIKDLYLADIAEELQWYDGSGLSRYNMFTPRAIVHVLNEIYQILTLEQIKRFFPAGGQSGTIKNWYNNENGMPYVYAKTGSLKNVHCLSGYLFTDSGKVLIFSFMHNNFTGPSSSVKEKMNKVLRFIKSNY